MAPELTSNVPEKDPHPAPELRASESKDPLDTSLNIPEGFKPNRGKKNPSALHFDSATDIVRPCEEGTAREIRSNGFLWIDVSSTNPSALAEAMQRFDIEAPKHFNCFQISETTRVEEFEGHLLIRAVTARMDNEKSGRLRFSDYTMFVGKDFLLTSHNGESEEIQSIWKRYGDRTLPAVHSAGPGAVVCRLLEESIERSKNALEDLGGRFMTWHHSLQAGGMLDHKAVTETIPLVQHSLNKLEQVTRENLTIVDALRTFDAAAGLFEEVKPDVATTRLRNRVTEMLALIQRREETLKGILETHDSLQNTRSNNLMKGIAIIGVPALVFQVAVTAAQSYDLMLSTKGWVSLSIGAGALIGLFALAKKVKLI